MRKAHPFRSCETDEFLLVEALPQALMNAIFLIAATRFFQIAVDTHSVFLSIFTLKHDSGAARIPMGMLPPSY